MYINDSKTQPKTAGAAGSLNGYRDALHVVEIWQQGASPPEEQSKKPDLVEV